MVFGKTLTAAGLAMAAVLSAIHEQVLPPLLSSPGRQETYVETAGKSEPNGANTQGDAAASPRVTMQLMFYGKADQAMKLYTSVIPNSKVTSMKRYGKGEPGAEGSVMHATFTLNGREIMCIDSNAKHDFTFTPATSLFVTCQNETQIDEFFAKLSRDGKVFMPLGGYPFAKKFVWFTDRYGVSWQLICPKD